MPLLFLLFLIVPIAELYVIIQVGQSIGVLPTLAILIIDSLLGAWLLRSQGRRAWLRFSETLRAGRPPARETIDGGLIILGGAFLLTPGFISDFFGLTLLVPPSRAVIRRLLVRRFAGRMAASLSARPPQPGRPGPGSSYDVDSTARDIT